MPRVHHVKKARKDNPAVKRGESYYWWKHRYGGKRYSVTRPRPSQLTQSAYYSQVRSLVEQIEDTTISDNDDFTSLRDDIVSEIESLGSECQDSRDNMPESLQDSPTGELLQERVDACENAQSELEGIDEFDDDEPEADEFSHECHECNGSGIIEGEEEDDDDEDCPECEGDGEVEGHEEFQQELESWQQRVSEWADEAKDSLIEHVSECEV